MLRVAVWLGEARCGPRVGPCSVARSWALVQRCRAGTASGNGQDHVWSATCGRTERNASHATAPTSHEIVQCDVCRSARTADRVNRDFPSCEFERKTPSRTASRLAARAEIPYLRVSRRNRLRNRQHTKQEQRIMQHVSRQRLVIGKLRQRLSRHRDDILAFTQVEHRGPPIRERRQLLEHAIGNLGRQLVQRLPLPAE